MLFQVRGASQSLRTHHTGQGLGEAGSSCPKETLPNVGVWGVRAVWL